jgi:hypothetical protein
VAVPRARPPNRVKSRRSHELPDHDEAKRDTAGDDGPDGSEPRWDGPHPDKGDDEEHDEANRPGHVRQRTATVRERRREVPIASESAKMALMTAYVVGATRVVERPWPSGPNDAEVETREVPEGMIHAVDPETGEALCGSRERLIILNTPWHEAWRLSYVDGPNHCGPCLARVSRLGALGMDDDTRQQLIAQLERFEREGDERRRAYASELLRRFRDGMEDGT